MLNKYSCIIVTLIIIVIIWTIIISVNYGSINLIDSIITNEGNENSVAVITDDFRLLTAFSGDHFEEALKSCKSIKNLEETRLWERGYMIAYILKNDTTIEQIAEYANECPSVELRIFNVTKFPEFVYNLYEYRWKPIIIEEVLNETDKILYFDSSVVFHGNNSSESLKDIFSKMDNKFSKCGVREFGGTIHSIFSATHPDMLKYYNFSEEIAKKNTMNGATLMAVTKKTAKKLVESWSDCAMKKECMAPEGSHRACDIPKLYSGEYGNCHRFDQSAISILLYQYCSRNSSDYVQGTPLISIERMGSPPP